MTPNMIWFFKPPSAAARRARLWVCGFAGLQVCGFAGLRVRGFAGEDLERISSRLRGDPLDEELAPTAARATRSRERSPNFSSWGGRSLWAEASPPGSIGRRPPEPAGCAAASRIATPPPSLKAGALFCR